MEMNKNRLDQKKEQDHMSVKRQHTVYQKLRGKSKREKTDGVARKSIIIERLQGDKEKTSQPYFTIALDFHHHTS